MHAPPPRPPDYGASPPGQVASAPADVPRDDRRKVLREVSQVTIPLDLKEELDRRTKSSDQQAAADELTRNKNQPVVDRRAERHR